MSNNYPAGTAVTITTTNGGRTSGTLAADFGWGDIALEVADYAGGTYIIHIPTIRVDTLVDA